MEKEILSELQEIKQLTMLGAKNVLTISDCALITGLSKSNLYHQCCKKTIPHWKSAAADFGDTRPPISVIPVHFSVV